MAGTTLFVSANKISLQQIIQVVEEKYLALLNRKGRDFKNIYFNKDRKGVACTKSSLKALCVSFVGTEEDQ